LRAADQTGPARTPSTNEDQQISSSAVGMRPRA
jgi:hypothetical protein